MNGAAVAKMRFIGADELRATVGFEDLIEPVSRAFQESSSRRAHNGLVVLWPGGRPELGDVYVKTGVVEGHDIYVVKVSPWFAVNVESGTPQGGFLAAFDSRTGHTIAVFSDEHYLSDLRTAAAGALAARELAPRTVAHAAVAGAGVQAFWQSLALYRERPFERLTIWSRNSSKVSSLAARLAERLPMADVRTADQLEPVVRAADVLITATGSREPIIRGDWLRPGQHITAVGADDPTKCELDAQGLVRARVFVDSLETSAANGDVCRAIEQGSYSISQVAGEIGDVLAGRAAGRASDDEITIAKFVGLGAQDVAAADTALEILQSSSPPVVGRDSVDSRADSRTRGQSTSAPSS